MNYVLTLEFLIKMDKDELIKYKWLDAQEVRPFNFTDAGNQLNLHKKMLEFLMED